MNERNIKRMSREAFMASLSYVGVLVFVPIISGDVKHPVVASHVKRGGAILAGEVIAIIAAQWFPRTASIAFLVLFVVSVLAFFFTIQKHYA